MHRVVVLALPEVVAFDLAIPAQVFGHRTERDRYAFVLCAQRPGAVVTTTGFTLHADHGLHAIEAADTVIVPGFMPTDDPPAPVTAALRLAYARGARVASVCVGAFALAAAGLLDGRAATTHWDHAEDLAARFPEVRVRPDVLYVDEGRILTSAGIAAGIDLCLHMVRNDHGAAAAAAVSRRMVAALHRPGGQAQYMQRSLPESGPMLAATCDWAISEMRRPLTVDELAAHAGYSARSFARHFVAETGMTPLRWLNAQRLLEARRLLEATDLPVEEVAHLCGLGSAANLRLHLARATSTTPTAYRDAFRGSSDTDHHESEESLHA
ncbi:MAG: helix-turn-helix domain-containing protein [Actinomycetota bacterium]|nr:helix-turn-helix domain-containing protein [Actinomycetota bacterium]